MPNTSFADVITGFDKLLVTTENNKEELPYVTELRSRLAEVTAGAKEAKIRQDALRAQLQQATRDLEGFLTEGTDIATRLRNGVRMQYGLKGEKLTEFGMQPRRKPQKAKPESTGGSTPASENTNGLASKS
ncbi:MAG TPA: hypothetical protein VGX68_29250 [Thermoanaerobaculia bacterium]|jgi:hypothetical protein|nr:hypothetical protein [Thermoanaerobaculia bacterium]